MQPRSCQRGPTGVELLREIVTGLARVGSNRAKHINDISSQSHLQHLQRSPCFSQNGKSCHDQVIEILLSECGAFFVG